MATTKTDRNRITLRIKEIALNEGAAAVGVSGIDRLGGRPSMDAGFLLPNARSIVSFMLPLDDEVIKRYLSKKNQAEYLQHETDVYRRLHRIGVKIADYLQAQGHKAIAAAPNLDYRYKESPRHKRIPHAVRQSLTDWMARDSSRPIARLKRKILPLLLQATSTDSLWDLTPSFSHRYGAVAAGIGCIGWSGNVLHPDYGARVFYNTAVTDLELEADPMLEEDPCDRCKICVKVCQSGYINKKEKDSVVIGGRTFEHNKKAHNLRCVIVCGGISGQNLHPEWSTWSPGKVELPESDDDLEEFWNDFVLRHMGKSNFYSRALANLTYHSELGFLKKKEDRFMTTCGNCQLVCSATKQTRRDNYRLLVASGVVLPYR